jgi:protoporphyrin/coproporphyrin ferrochelatase
MTANANCDGVLLIGFGGPRASEEIRPFLDRVLKGRPLPPERYEQVVHHYEFMGGRSPYNDITMRQAAALSDMLRGAGCEVPVRVGMRNSPPYIEDALRELGAHGVRRAIGFILAGYRSEASWDRYQDNVAEARNRIGAAAPIVDYPAPWHGHPLFIEAVADRVRTAMARLGETAATAELIFTAHSIPLAMAADAPYVDQLNQSARLAVSALGCERWSLAFQSRSGSPREPWLEPDVGAALRQLAGRAAVVMPLGFLCDHVEVLYDLDVEAAAIARACGVRMERAATVGDHPRFIEMIASIVRRHCTASDPA